MNDLQRKVSEKIQIRKCKTIFFRNSKDVINKLVMLLQMVQYITILVFNFQLQSIEVFHVTSHDHVYA